MEQRNGHCNIFILAGIKKKLKKLGGQNEEPFFIEFVHTKDGLVCVLKDGSLGTAKFDIWYHSSDRMGKC